METRQRLEQLLTQVPAQPPQVDASQSVVLYGAGNLGKMALDFLAHVNVGVEYVLDQQANGTLDKIPIFPAYTRPKDPSQPILVTIGNTAYEPILYMLKINGWHNVFPFYDYAEAFREHHPLNNGWFSGALSKEEKVRIVAVMEGWEDTWSREAYLQFLAWRIAREEWIFKAAPVIPENRYFIPEIMEGLTYNEVLVDGGAYDGRLFKSFCEKAKVREAHLFEPDPKNFTALKANIGKDPRVHCYTQALGEREESAVFQQGFGMASRLSEGGKQVSVVRLDDLGLAPTFVKLHLEGGEYAALIGGMETLKKHRPLLALTVYHNRDGLWKTALLLMQTLPRYRFYFRLHSWCGTGAVIYGVPA